jgi:ribose transport system permease protein
VPPGVGETADEGSSPNPEGRSKLRGSRRKGQHLLSGYGLFIALAVIVIIFGVTTPATFLTARNFDTIVNSQAVLMFLALALTITLAVGEFDLSIAAVMGFSSCLIGVLTVREMWPLWSAIILTVAFAACVGLFNGFLAVKIGINAFIATLATGTVLGGLTLLITGGQILNGINAGLITGMTKSVLGVQYPVFGGLALALILWYVLDLTPIGRYVYFTGEAREAARLVGVNVKRVRWSAFIVSGIISGIAGVVLLGQVGVGDPSAGPSYLLPAFAAAFLGATTIKPGRFNAWGTVIAQYFLIAGVTGLELLGAQSWVDQVFNGGALIVAVAFATWTFNRGVGGSS